MAICGGCDHPIFDRYLFHVLDKPWHAACICCNDCKAPLADKCFSRDGILLCKDDFTRRFGTKCAGCDRLVDKNDLVRRARDKVFHVDCFCCTVCQKRLDTGEELYILNGNRFICKQDYICRPGGSDCGSDEIDDDDGGSDDIALKTEVDLAVMGLTDLSPSGAVTPTQQRSDSQQSGGGDSANTNASGKGGQSQDENGAGAGTKRRGPRTTIKAKQLETLKAAFAATPKPTRHIREQLAQETGLNMRVIQVWFQNRRSKERRMKQLRYGGFRPGRRNRSSMQRDEMIGPAMFQDGMGRPGDPYFQPPIGFYCDMYGQEGPPPHPQDMPLPPPGAPHAPFLLSTQDESGMLAAAAHLDGHQAPNGCGDGSYMMDEGAMRPPHSSPNMPLGAQDETFRVLHGFHQTSQDLKTETSVPPGW